MNTYLLMITFRVFFAELAVSAVNYFVLMRRVYEPRVGVLRAHRIGMTTRIVYIFAFAYLIVDSVPDYSAPDLLAAGAFWMALVLAFEWGGSLLIGRPVREILVGWHVGRGYMWPYVLLAYLLSPLLVGMALRP